MQIPYGPVQSLPNLVPTSSSSPNSSAPPSTPGDPPLATPPPAIAPAEHSSSPHHHHAPRLSSPVPSRGISYPPLSPKSSLRRSVAIQQSNSVPNPSTTGVQPVNVCRSTPINSSVKNINNNNNNTHSSGHPPPTISDGITIPVITTGTGPPDEEFEDESEENSSKEYDDKPSPAARKGRIERGADARRYHTAGAIEDIKVKRYRR